MYRKNIRKDLERVLKLFLQNKQELAHQLLEEVSVKEITGENLYQFRQLLLLLLIGELYGLHTFKSILSSVGIKSSNCYKIWGKFTYRDLFSFISKAFTLSFQFTFEELVKKSASTWSRHTVTIVVDETIFKTWLKKKEDDGLFIKFFGKYYSGQTGKGEYGFRFSLAGVSIQDTFYPLVFSPVPKEEKCEKTAKEAIETIEKLMRQLSEKQGFTIPNLGISVDSGYNKKELVDYCDSFKTPIDFICVPKKNHKIETGRFTGKINQFITEIFLPKEQEFYQNHPADIAFTLRIRVFYCCRDRMVTLLFFRLNNSDKVSVIFSSNLAIKAKTLRRKWFQRTKIELFFRVVKHTLKVQQSTANTCANFFKKVTLFFLKAVFVIKFQNFCRLSFKEDKRITFWQIRKQFQIYLHLDPIFEVLEKGGFCNKTYLQKVKNQYFRQFGNSPI